jgi:hypothetical protein
VLTVRIYVYASERDDANLVFAQRVQVQPLQRAVVVRLVLLRPAVRHRGTTASCLVKSIRVLLYALVVHVTSSLQYSGGDGILQGSSSSSADELPPPPS